MIVLRNILGDQKVSHYLLLALVSLPKAMWLLYNSNKTKKMCIKKSYTQKTTLNYQTRNMCNFQANNANSY